MRKAHKDSNNRKLRNKNPDSTRRSRLTPRRVTLIAVAAAGLLWASYATATANPPPASSSSGTASAKSATTNTGSTNSAAASAGATTPFTSYETEAGALGGGASVVSLTALPTNQYSSAALEASGHAYVHLAGTGQSVQWTNNTGQPISFVNLRYSMPDTPGGGGTTSTLDLYVNGMFRQALNVNSKQTWIYENSSNYSSPSTQDQNPADGSPRVFWDEAHAFVTGTPIAAGSTFSIVKDSANSQSYYDVDVIDVENPPAPIAQPANSISITSCGAVADNAPTNGSGDPNAQDSTGAIQNCINQAQSQGRTLWIPQGTFYLKGTAGLNANGITITGAGMWYSEIYRQVPLPNNVGLGAVFGLTSCHVSNFHIDSNATSRATVDGDGGSMDTSGTNWTADSIWTQHTESGYWASGTGGTVSNARVGPVWADGINLNNVSLGNTVGNNLTAHNNFVRGTGDDAMAINSVNYNTNPDGSKTYYTAMSNITLTNNSLIAPWGGKGIGIYGGGGHHVQNNYISDTARYIGLGVGKFGVNGSDLTSATVSGNTVVRSGGNAYNQCQPALHIGNGGDGQGVGIVDSATVSGNTIINSVCDGVGFSTSTNTQLQNNTITSPWRNGIVIQPPFYPAPSGSATITGNTVSGLRSGMTAYADNSSGFTASVSNNSWQGGGPTPEGPYGGTPAGIPGTVQAENYDTGGQGVAYNVTSVNGTGNSYRTDGVDLEATTDTGGGSDLGWTGGGQWFKYTVNVASAGTYTLGLRLAAPSAVTGALHLSNVSGTNLSGAVNIPATGGWQNWTTVTASVTLPAGQQVLTLNEDTGGWNINYLTFAATSSGGGPINSSAWYEVVNQNSSSCVDDTNSSTANGTHVQQFTCGGSQNQQWQFVSVGGGYYQVLNRNAAGQNESWDVTGGPSATASGTPVQTWSYGGGTNQQWQAVAGSGGYYTFVARNSGLCLDVPNASTANGVQLQVYTCNGTGAQNFKLVQQS